MPHSLLRALKHRSTPTLPSERLLSSRNKEGQLPGHLFFVPSIFITIPDEDGGDRWCAFAGTVAPAPEALISTGVVPPSPSGGSSFDAPLPDFVALEDTIAQLRRAGETPTFRRPTHPDQVVLPKRKNDGKDGNSSTRATRPRPKRPQTSPTTGQERAHADAIAVASLQNEVNSAPYIPRDMCEVNKTSLPAKVLKSMKKSKKYESGNGFAVSTSHDSIASQPSSPQGFSPSDWNSAPTNSPYNSVSSGKLKKRSSIGWLFNKRNRDAREMQPMPTVTRREAVEQNMNLQEFLGETQEIYVPERFADVPLSPPMDSPGTTETTFTSYSSVESLDKPLPPLPVEDRSFNGNGNGNGITGIETNQMYPSELGPAMQTVSPSKTSSKSSGDTQKLKRKFSLKSLREKFKPSTSHPPVPPLPPLPPLPAKDFVRAIPTREPHPIEIVPPSVEDVNVALNGVSQEVAEADMTHSRDERSLSLDEDDSTGLSTTSEDSSSSASSTPTSSPPHTPASVRLGPVFGILQQEGFSDAKAIASPIRLSDDQGAFEALDTMNEGPIQNSALLDDEVTITGTPKGSMDTVRPTLRTIPRSNASDCSPFLANSLVTLSPPSYRSSLSPASSTTPS